MAIDRLVPHIPIHKYSHSRKAHIQSDHQVSDKHEGSDQSLVLRTRRLLHDVRLRWIESQSSRRQSICDQIHPQQLHWRKSLRNAQHRREEDGSHFADVRADQVPNESLHVLIDGSTLLDRCHNRAEVVIHQHHRGSLLRHLGSVDAHRDTDVCLLQCWSVIHTIARHRGYLTVLTEKTDQLLLVNWLRTSKHKSLLSTQYL